MLKTEASGYESLFPDGGQLVTSKSADDLRNLARARIAEHEQRERQRAEAKAEAERRQAEADAQRDPQHEAVAAEAAAPERAQPAAASAPPTITPTPEDPPSDDQIIECVADAFNVDHTTARDWIAGMDLIGAEA